MSQPDKYNNDPHQGSHDANYAAFVSVGQGPRVSRLEHS